MQRELYGPVGSECLHSLKLVVSSRILEPKFVKDGLWQSFHLGDIKIREIEA